MPARERKLLAEDRLSHGETKLRMAEIDREGDLNLSGYAECKSPTVEYLIDKGFLKASEAALRMLA